MSTSSRGRLSRPDVSVGFVLFCTLSGLTLCALQNAAAHGAELQTLWRYEAGG